MKEIIKTYNRSAEFYTDEKCYITELSNSIDDPGVSIARARVEAGVTTRWHRLKHTAERYCIISGKGVVEVGELPPQEISTGDVVIIPPLCRQRISNTGVDELVFLAICTPRFIVQNYQDIEQ